MFRLYQMCIKAFGLNRVLTETFKKLQAFFFTKELLSAVFRARCENECCKSQLVLTLFLACS